MSLDIASTPRSARVIPSADVVSQREADNATSTNGQGAKVDMLWVARLENARVAYTLLSTLHSGKKNEQINVVISAKGVKCTVEHSRAVQGNAVLDSSLFEEFRFTSAEEKEEFAVPLPALLDILSIYGTLSNNITVEFGYKCYGGPLVLLLLENDVVTDAGIRTLEPFSPIKYDMRSAELCCRLIMKSSSLNDALSEIDWTADSLTWEILSQPPYFRIFVHHNNASHTVEFPRDCEIFELYDCPIDAKFQYKLNLLQPCLKALAAAKKTQVRMNRLGLLSLQHMITTEDGSTSFVDFFVVPKEDEEGDDE